MVTAASAGVVRISTRPVLAARIGGAFVTPDAGRDGVGAGKVVSGGTGAAVAGKSTVVAATGGFASAGFTRALCAAGDGADFLALAKYAATPRTASAINTRNSIFPRPARSGSDTSSWNALGCCPNHDTGTGAS